MGPEQPPMFTKENGQSAPMVVTPVVTFSPDCGDFGALAQLWPRLSRELQAALLAMAAAATSPTPSR